MTCTETTTEQEYTVAITVSFRGEEMDLLIKPDTDLDGQFFAYSPDLDAEIIVNGWLCTIL